MSVVPGLTIIVATADPERLHAALSVAAAHAALDRPTRMFLQGDAVALLRIPIGWAEDGRYSAAGLPTLGELVAEAAAIGVRITACQSGLALASLELSDLPPGIDAGGILELLTRHEADQLLMA
jgi:predicted peroxiredoxin